MLPFELRKKLHKALFDSKDEKTKHNLSEKNSRLTCTVLNLLFHWSSLICTSIVFRDRGIVMSQSLLFYQPVINNLSNRCRSKKLGKALFSGKVATKHNLSQKKYLGDFQNRRSGFMVLFLAIIRTREI